jgi:hypothetical protein
MHRSRYAALLALGLFFLSACETSVADRIINVNGAGAVLVLLFRDENQNAAFNPGTDTNLRDQIVTVRARGASSDAFTVRTDSIGFALFPPLPVGRYTLRVSPTTLGDSLQTTGLGSQEFTVVANDTVLIELGVSFPVVSPTQARALAVGKKVWVLGTALNGPNLFGDSTVHLTDTLSAIRATRVPPAPVFTADSVMFLGRRSSRSGQPTLVVTNLLLRGTTTAPPPDTLTAARITTADGGQKDARLAIVLNATITDTATVNGNRVLTVRDASGTARIVLSQTIGFTPFSNYPLNGILDATGLLVPDPAGGSWVLKPRNRADLVAR